MIACQFKSYEVFFAKIKYWHVLKISIVYTALKS